MARAATQPASASRAMATSQMSADNSRRAPDDGPLPAVGTTHAVCWEARAGSALAFDPGSSSVPDPGPSTAPLRYRGPGRSRLRHTSRRVARGRALHAEQPTHGVGEPCTTATFWPRDQTAAGSSSASTRSNSVQAQVGQVQLVNAPSLAAASADDQLARLSRLPHFSHFLMRGMGTPSLAGPGQDRTEREPPPTLPSAPLA